MDSLAGAATTSHRATGESSPTIYDIARAVGVAPSTVSRALNRPERVSTVTLELVRQAAAELYHQANPLAKAVAVGRTGALGLIVADISCPTLADIIRGAEAVASARDCKLVLAEAAAGGETEVVCAKRILAAVDGLLLASPSMETVQLRHLAAVKPLVVVNRDVDGVACVVPNLHTGIGEAVRSLAAEGHHRLLYVGGPEESWLSGKRWQSIQDACTREELVATMLSSPAPTVECGRRVAREVLASGATAVLTYNDPLAVGLMQELQATGVRVPGDISIVGSGDMSGAVFTSPPLSSIRSFPYSCAATAATYLLDSLSEGANPGSRTIEIETELVLRGSSGRAYPE